MSATRIISGENSNSEPIRPGHHWPMEAAIFALALCLGISPLAAQTVTGFTRVTRKAATSDPNKTTSKDPNATTANDPNQKAATDPNKTAGSEPNQPSVVDPNQPPVVDPNKPPVVDPHQPPVVDPNKPPVVDPNKPPAQEPNAGQFNKAGNILIADRLNHRVIEVDRDTHEIVWQFGDGSSVAGPKSVVAPSDAERVGEWTLICGASVAASTDPNGAQELGDHRVLLVDRSGNIFWQYGQAGVAGSDVNQLNTPVCAVYLPYGNILICDQGNHRVIEVSMVTKTIVWQHGQTRTPGTSQNQLRSPGGAQLLDNGNILIADSGNNRVIEVSRRHTTVWRYGGSNADESLNGPSFACRLENGNTLITDTGNNRILEIDGNGRKVMEFVTNKRSGSVADPLPTRAVRLDNGDTLISDQFNQQVIEIDSGSNIVFTQGSIGVAGNGLNQLNCPYDAKAIGDYTGLTLPSLDTYYGGSDEPEPPPVLDGSNGSSSDGNSSDGGSSSCNSSNGNRSDSDRHERDRHAWAREQIMRR